MLSVFASWNVPMLLLRELLGEKGFWLHIDSHMCHPFCFLLLLIVCSVNVCRSHLILVLIESHRLNFWHLIADWWLLSNDGRLFISAFWKALLSHHFYVWELLKIVNSSEVCCCHSNETKMQNMNTLMQLSCFCRS